MRAKGIRVISVTEPEPPPDPLGDLILYAMGTFAKLEQQNVIQNTQKTRGRLREEGKLLCNGPHSYGYTYNRSLRTREIEPEEAAVMVRVFELYATGRYSLRQVAQLLNDEGIPGPEGRRWIEPTLSNRLRDPSYYGEPFLAEKRYATDSRRENGRRREVNISREQWRKVGPPTPAIVSRELWDKVQVRLRDTTKRPQSAKLDLWLRGHLFCPECGHGMSASTERNDESHYYRCNRSARSNTGKCRTGFIKVPVVEDLVWTKILTARESPEYLRARVAEALAGCEVPDFEEELQRRQEAREKLLAKLARLLDRWGDLEDEDEVMKEAAERSIERTRAKIEREDDLVAELERRVAVSRRRAAILQDVEQSLLNADGIAADADTTAKARVLDSLDIRVEAWRDRVRDPQVRVILFASAMPAADEMVMKPSLFVRDGVVQEGVHTDFRGDEMVRITPEGTTVPIESLSVYAPGVAARDKHPLPGTVLEFTSEGHLVDVSSRADKRLPRR
jgi:site-specific DNA recombinase